MKAWTLGRMCILKHSILALERAPNMYRTPSTSGEPPPAVRELSANCIVYVSIYIHAQDFYGIQRVLRTCICLPNKYVFGQRLVELYR